MRPFRTPVSCQLVDYAGKTLAVDESTGNLYSGTFELTVNWDDANGEVNISARIINLKGVYGSTTDWFQHDSPDGGTIFLSGIEMDGSTTAEFSAVGGTASTPVVRFGYRVGGARDGTLAGGATISGKFVGNGQSKHGLSRKRLPTAWT